MLQTERQTTNILLIIPKGKFRCHSHKIITEQYCISSLDWSVPSWRGPIALSRGCCGVSPDLVRPQALPGSQWGWRACPGGHTWRTGRRTCTPWCPCRGGSQSHRIARSFSTETNIIWFKRVRWPIYGNFWLVNEQTHLSNTHQQCLLLKCFTLYLIDCDAQKAW